MSKHTTVEKFSHDLDGGCPQFAIQFGKGFNNLRRAKSGMVKFPTSLERSNILSYPTSLEQDT